MPKLSFVKILFLIFIAYLRRSLVQAQTSVFSYQGKLSDGSRAATGQYDFTFKLFTAAEGGTQIRPNIVPDIPITGGIFMVSLDFGTASFINGAAKFLKINRAEVNLSSEVKKQFPINQQNEIIKKQQIQPDSLNSFIYSQNRTANFCQPKN